MIDLQKRLNIKRQMFTAETDADTKTKLSKQIQKMELDLEIQKIRQKIDQLSGGGANENTTPPSIA